MIKKFETIITPFNKKRMVHMYLPDDCELSGKKYPVIYMYDGHNLFYDSDATFGKAWGLKEFMDEYDNKMIIVGIQCEDSDMGRTIEYFPYRKIIGCFPHMIYINGKGDTFLEWLTGEFKDYIDANFPTLKDRDHTMIAGSSMGGIMAMYAVVKFNSTFKYAACLSSAFMYCKRELIKEIKNCDTLENTKIYMDYGTNEKDVFHISMKKANKIHYDIKDCLINKNASVLYYVDEGGKHNEASWQRRIPLYMNFLFNEGE